MAWLGTGLRVCGGAVLSVSLGACIGAPGIPGGPLQGTGVTFAGSYGYAVAPARIAMRSAAGQPSSFRDPAGDAQNFPVIPSRLGTRIGLTDYFDAAGDFSWLDSGLEFRLGLPEGTQPLPLALSFGLRRGDWGILERRNMGASEQRLRLEAYPRLARLRYVRLNLIASAGVSTGRRYHPAILPDRYSTSSGPETSTGSEAEGGFDDPVPEVDPQILRDETRVEGSAGVEVRQNQFFASLVLMPYLVAHAGAASASCHSCQGFTVTSYDSSFGAALFLSIGINIKADSRERAR